MSRSAALRGSLRPETPSVVREAIDSDALDGISASDELLNTPGQLWSYRESAIPLRQVFFGEKQTSTERQFFVGL
ncbi:hypothetical protein MGEO_03525 [Marivita geojedonensis]|uniref:Uncharacterized protein n=1 Tax=Marivita geojedonensis TaxID=1123756 RepID=A0A1X4NPH3_9RHOB|nr:hypothetical protein MGEO_03525 [Marivita geojedonensis]